MLLKLTQFMWKHHLWSPLSSSKKAQVFGDNDGDVVFPCLIVLMLKAGPKTPEYTAVIKHFESVRSTDIIPGNCEPLREQNTVGNLTLEYQFIQGNVGQFPGRSLFLEPVIFVLCFEILTQEPFTLERLCQVGLGVYPVLHYN